MITKLFAARLKKDLLRLAVFSLITVVIWLILVTYRTLNKSLVAPDVKKQLLPLTASLALDTMDQVSQRLETPAIDWGSLGQTEPILVVPESTESASPEIVGASPESSEASPDLTGASPSGTTEL